MSTPQNPFDPVGPGPSNPYQSSSAPPGYGPPGYGPPKQQNPLAIASLVCGILGIVLTCCCGLFGLPLPLLAIILGFIAMNKPELGGRGMAIAGIACGVVSILLAVVLLIITLSNPELMRQFQQMQNQ